MHYPLRLLLSAPPWITEPDARDFIQRVEAADGAALEDGIKLAYADFIRGCKADGIWNAIKASCILAGARTLSGALVPLVGTAPTNFNFVSGDYNRKAGLVGDGSTKYLNSNRNDNQDSQNSLHQSVYVNTAQIAASGAYIGLSNFSTNRGSQILANTINNTIVFRNRQLTNLGLRTGSGTTGFLGHSRNNSATEFAARAANTTTTETVSSNPPEGINHLVFARLNGASIPPAAENYSNARIAFYSIGESLDLALLDARVTTLINAIGAAIP